MNYERKCNKQVSQSLIIVIRMKDIRESWIEKKKLLSFMI